MRETGLAKISSGLRVGMVSNGGYQPEDCVYSTRKTFQAFRRVKAEGVHYFNLKEGGCNVVKNCEVIVIA